MNDITLKFKVFKKILSISLAGYMLFQACLVPYDVYAEEPKTKTATSVKVFGSIGGIAIVVLAGATIIEALKNEQQQFDIRLLESRLASQKQRIDDLEANLRGCNNFDVDHIDENSEQMGLLLRGIAEDWIEMFQTPTDDQFINSDLDFLKGEHVNANLTEEDIVNVLRATIRHRSEIKEHNYANWLTDCNFPRVNIGGVYIDSLQSYTCRSALIRILRALRNWEYQNRVSYSLEKNRLLDYVCKILNRE